MKRLLARFVRWFQQRYCDHAYYLDTLNRLSPDCVECTCCGCGKVLQAEYGLALDAVCLGRKKVCICKAHPIDGYWLSVDCPAHGNRWRQGQPAGDA